MCCIEVLNSDVLLLQLKVACHELNHENCKHLDSSPHALATFKKNLLMQYWRTAASQG